MVLTAMRRLFAAGSRRFIFATVLLVPFFAYAQDGAKESLYAFSFSQFFGFKYGHSEEIVYKSSKSDVVLSQLIWEMKPLFYLGGAFDFRLREPMIRRGFFINAAAQAGIPVQTGDMTDKDWLAPNNGFSHFSRHSNFTDEAWFLDVKAGMSFPVRDITRLQFFATISFMWLKWTARDGYTQYADLTGNTYKPWNPSLPKTYLHGAVISYEQNWVMLSPGISAHIPFLEFFEAGLYFQIAPLVYCSDLDKHYLRNTNFTETMWGGFMLEPGLEFVFSPYEWLGLSINVS
ncbi:MAG: omptin family outer membrane protease, partial [Spirochaetaceae bacterium]|nr:omptin family outer membrane protease [Spirochaetaceae bacterium]